MSLTYVFELFTLNVSHLCFQIADTVTVYITAIENMTMNVTTPPLNHSAVNTVKVFSRRSTLVIHFVDFLTREIFYLNFKHRQTHKND